MECSICLEPLGERTMTLLCSHTFHAACLAQHIKRSARETLWGDRFCPLCRSRLARHKTTPKDLEEPLLDTPFVLQSYDFYIGSDGVAVLFMRPQKP